MSNRAEVYLEDAEDGTDACNVRFVFPQGFDEDSPSHQMCNFLRKALDDLAESGALTKIGEEVRETIEGPAAEPLVAVSR